MAIHTIRKEDLEYLVADGLSVPHAFTTRLGGVSTGHLASCNLGMHRGDDPARVEENYARLSRALDLDLSRLVLTRQTHSSIVRAVSREDCMGLDHHLYPESDALITATPGVSLAVFTADCTPILLHDPVTGAVGAVHAGWRGTAAGIAEKAVQAMTEHYGAKAKDIRAAIGPNIGPCCFETHRDVPDAMLAALGSDAQAHIRPAGEKYYVNLKSLNALFLQRAGVAHIEISQACTACDPSRFWSHRRMGPARGSQGALILCKGGQR